MGKARRGRYACARSRGCRFPLLLPKIGVLVGLGMDWVLVFLSAPGMLPRGTLLAPALLPLLLLLLEVPGTQSVDFSVPAANNTVFGSNPALRDPELECPRCDAMFGMLIKADDGTKAQNILMQVRWRGQISVSALYL